MTSRRALALTLATLAAAVLTAPMAQPRPGAAEPETLRAFQRAKRPSDVLGHRLASNLHVIDSRRIATYVDRRGRHASMYVAKTRTELCELLVQATPFGEGAGGGCSPKATFLGPGRHVAAQSGRLFAGVVANEVARVVIVGSRGVRHPITVTADGGFIYDCRAYNGCAGLIACVEAYARDGKFLSGQPWLAGGCRRR